MKTIECLCLGTNGLIVAPWNFDVLKTNIFAKKHSIVFKISQQWLGFFDKLKLKRFLVSPKF